MFLPISLNNESDFYFSSLHYDFIFWWKRHVSKIILWWKRHVSKVDKKQLVGNLTFLRYGFLKVQTHIQEKLSMYKSRRTLEIMLKKMIKGKNMIWWNLKIWTGKGGGGGRGNLELSSKLRWFQVRQRLIAMHFFHKF